MLTSHGPNENVVLKAMARVKAKLRELRDADVQFISLVDRAATRMPFRVLKRDKEREMDLTKIFKRDEKPAITAVVVLDQTDEAITTTVANAIKEAGLTVGQSRKSEDGATQVYSQVPAQPAGVQLVKLSEQVVVAIKGLGPIDPENEFGDMVASQGFYCGVNVAMDVLNQKINHLLYKAEDSAGASKEVKDLMGQFTDYITSLISALPGEAFKADFLVNEALNQMEVEKADKTPKMVPVLDKDGKAVLNPDGTPKMAPAGAPVCKADEPVAEPVVVPEKAEPPVVEKPAEAPAVEKPVEVPVVPVVEQLVPVVEVSVVEPPAVKAEDITALTASLQLIAQKFDGLSTTVNTVAAQVKEVAEKQAAAQKVVDALATKSETLEGKLNSTVLAAAPAGDVPTTGLATKQDLDPRSAPTPNGTWDTAFTRKRDRK
jgi:hypothetical protein